MKRFKLAGIPWSQGWAVNPRTKHVLGCRHKETHTPFPRFSPSSSTSAGLSSPHRQLEMAFVPQFGPLEGSRVGGRKMLVFKIADTLDKTWRSSWPAFSVAAPSSAPTLSSLYYQLPHGGLQGELAQLTSLCKVGCQVSTLGSTPEFSLHILILPLHLAVNSTAIDLLDSTHLLSLSPELVSPKRASLG